MTRTYFVLQSHSTIINIQQIQDSAVAIMEAYIKSYKCTEYVVLTKITTDEYGNIVEETEIKSHSPHINVTSSLEYPA